MILTAGSVVMARKRPRSGDRACFTQWVLRISFQIPQINCLDGSGGLIKDHGDIANAFVTYAFASAVSQT